MRSLLALSHSKRMLLFSYADFLGLRVRACARFSCFASRIVGLSRHILEYNGQRTGLVQGLVGAAGVLGRSVL
jgi:hypothetical protein